MVFSSAIFLFLFLPVVLVLYHGFFFLPVSLGSRARTWFTASNGFLLLCSLIFYFWGEQYRVFIFLATTFLDYVAALLIVGTFAKDPPQLEVGGARTNLQRLTLALSICSNLTLLAYFKYFNFLAHSYDVFVRSLGLPTWQLKTVPIVALPLGISFFIFHSMSYTIDVYSGRVKATRSFVDYACYVMMFPQLVAGPIVRYSYVAKALVSRAVTAEYFASGVTRFMIGLSKKVLVANTVARIADKIFALPTDALTPAVAWLGVGAYTIQIYFDFSGYSDMAIGLGRMFGFELPRNFNFPYIASSVREFWRRWHISLSTWFRDYLYIPLGGNEGGSFRTGVNLLVVFFLCGLWHGAKWTFVVWGLYHGFFLIMERTGWTHAFNGRARWLGHVYTILVVMGAGSSFAPIHSARLWHFSV
jgi:alginate O-acetyltransferase complex protein AlgI